MASRRSILSRCNRHDELCEDEAVLNSVTLEIDERPTAGRVVFELENIQRRSVEERRDDREGGARAAAQLQISAHGNDVGT